LPNALSKSIRNSIGNSISNAMANAIANATANAMANAVTDHGTVAGRPKATGYLHFDALWKPFGCLLHDFLVPFNTFCPPRPNFSGPRDDTGHISGPGRKKLRKSCKVAELWPPLGSPICDHFGKVADFLAACFLLFFWVPSLLTNCRSGVHLGSNLRCFSVYLGPLEIGLKR